jgi:DNA segregation ATPase FtsK/SpoIIIE-like protein
VALAWQVINAHEQPRPVMLDPQGVTFTPFEGDKRLLYPLASDPNDIIAILDALMNEMERRQKLFARWRGIATLAQYNKVVEPDERLPVIPIFFDEFGLVSDHREIARHTKKLTQAGRKVGISLIAGTQTWGADEIATALRANLATSVQFFARDKHQSRILLGAGDAAEITRPGQAFAILPGQPGLIEIQAPDPSSVVEITPTRIEEEDQPVMPDMPDPEPTPTEARILEMAAGGASYNAIAREVYQSTGGKQTQMIKDTLAKYGKE